MAKHNVNAVEKGIKVGQKIKVFNFKKGESQNGEWCLVVYEEKKKQQDNNYITLQKYTLWINNMNSIYDSIDKDVTIVIDKINGINFTQNTYVKKASGQTVSERVCNVYCDVLIDDLPSINDNDSIQQALNEEPVNRQFYQEDNNDISIDDVNLPF